MHKVHLDASMEAVFGRLAGRFQAPLVEFKGEHGENALGTEKLRRIHGQSEHLQGLSDSDYPT